MLAHGKRPPQHKVPRMDNTGEQTKAIAAWLREHPGVFAVVSRSYSFSTAALVGSRTQSSRLSTMIGNMTRRYCGGR